jgi:RND family efflux transporter MFP subunit
VAAKDERDLAFKVGGLLARVEVREGQVVRRGQVLAALDATELAAGVRAAEEGLGKARRDAARAAELAAAEAAPRSAAEDARTAEAVAEAALAAARFNLRHAALVAPDDGWVERRTAEPGEVVAPGRPVLRVSGRGRGFVVRAAVADRDVLDLAPGMPARVTIDARPERPIAGRVAEGARRRARHRHLAGGGGDRRPRSGAALTGLTAKVEIERAVPAPAPFPWPRWWTATASAARSGRSTAAGPAGCPSASPSSRGTGPCSPPASRGS